MKTTILIVGITLMSMNLHSQDNNSFLAVEDSVQTIVDSVPKIQMENVITAGDTANFCINGAMDGALYHGKKGGAFVLGFLFGPFALIGTSASNPTPEKGNDTYIMSDNRSQFKDPQYRRCYRNRVRKQLTTSAALGWLTEVLLVFVLINY